MKVFPVSPRRFLRLSFLLFLFVASHPLIAQHKTAFNGDSAATILHTISVDIGPRPMGSPAEHRALEFAVAKFREYGCDTAYIMPMERSSRANTTSGIAIGIKRGASGRTICLGGHMDSAGPEIPGTNDDGSGSATVIELARVLAGTRHPSTLLFCCFGGEEEGLEGSKYFTDHYPELDSIALMLQIDMTNGMGTIELDPDTHDKSAPQWLVRAAIEEFDKLGYEHLEYPTHFFSLNYAAEEGSGSDHEYFLRKGIPAIDFTTDVGDPIHNPADNWENFDPRGLQRSGDVFLNLVNRFDAGVPPGKPTQYWLYLIGTTPIFISLQILWCIYVLCFVVAVAGLILLYRRRPKPIPPLPIEVTTTIAGTGQGAVPADFLLPPPVVLPKRIRFSTLKVLLFSLIVGASAWFSPDLVNLMKGVRHAWIIDYQLNYLLAALGALTGLSIAAQCSEWLKITKDSFPLYRNAMIILLIAFLASAMVSTKTALYPALSLWLIGLAALLRSGKMRLIFLVLAPLPILRLIFSEWSVLILRLIAFGMPAHQPVTTTLFQLAGATITAMLVWPFLLAGIAILRDSGAMQSNFLFLRSNLWLGGLVAIFLGYGTYLAQRPSYNSFWMRDIRVNQKFLFKANSSKAEFTNEVQSSEYMNGLGISHGGTDTLLTGKPTWFALAPRTPYDTGWCRVQRSENRSPEGSGSMIDLSYTLDMKFRPYTITFSYRSGRKQLPAIETPLLTTESRGSRQIRWYSFPDTHLVVPLKFHLASGDSITETISVVFDSLAYPMRFTRELQYVIPRTEYAWERSYRF